MNMKNAQEISGIQQRYFSLKQAAVYLGLAKKTLYTGQ